MIDAEHGLGAQSGNRVERIARSQTMMRDKAKHSVGVESAGEMRDRAKDGGLVPGEQRVAPLEKRKQTTWDTRRRRPPSGARAGAIEPKAKR